jgi:hypothetical protein
MLRALYFTALNNMHKYNFIYGGDVGELWQ